MKVSLSQMKNSIAKSLSGEETLQLWKLTPLLMQPIQVFWEEEEVSHSDIRPKK